MEAEVPCSTLILYQWAHSCVAPVYILLKQILMLMTLLTLTVGHLVIQVDLYWQPIFAVRS